MLWLKIVYRQDKIFQSSIYVKIIIHMKINLKDYVLTEIKRLNKINELNEEKKRLEKVLNEGAGDYYFDEHDKVENYPLTIVSKKTETKGEGEDQYFDYIFKVSGLPKIGHLNTRNGTLIEMLNFLAKYAEENDDELSQWICNGLTTSDEITIEDANNPSVKYSFEASDLFDFMRKYRAPRPGIA